MKTKTTLMNNKLTLMITKLMLMKSKLTLEGKYNECKISTMYIFL